MIPLREEARPPLPTTGRVQGVFVDARRASMAAGGSRRAAACASGVACATGVSDSNGLSASPCTGPDHGPKPLPDAQRPRPEDLRLPRGFVHLRPFPPMGPRPCGPVPSKPGMMTSFRRLCIDVRRTVNAAAQLWAFVHNIDMRYIPSRFERIASRRPCAAEGQLFGFEPVMAVYRWTGDAGASGAVDLPAQWIRLKAVVQNDPHGAGQRL